MVKFERSEIEEESVSKIDLEDVADSIDHRDSRTRKITGNDGNQIEILKVARDPQLLRDENGNANSFYFRYVVRQPDEYTSATDNGIDESRMYEPRDVTDFLLTTDGEIAYESTGTPEGPLRFLFGDGFPDYIEEVPVTQSTIDTHYHRSDRVSKIKLIFDENEPSDGPATITNLPEAVQQLVATGESATFSVGHYHQTRDLKQVDLIDTMVKQSRLSTVSAIHGESNSVTLSDAGWAQFNIPEDVDPHHRAEIIRNQVSVLF